MWHNIVVEHINCAYIFGKNKTRDAVHGRQLDTIRLYEEKDQIAKKILSFDAIFFFQMEV